MAGSSAGNELDRHEQFSLGSWTEANDKIESVTWSVWGFAKKPDGAPAFDMELLAFDAENRKLYINYQACSTFGVEVENELMCEE